MVIFALTVSPQRKTLLLIDVDVRIYACFSKIASLYAALNFPCVIKVYGPLGYIPKAVSLYITVLINRVSYVRGIGGITIL